jgi:hypothetical protein
MDEQTQISIHAFTDAVSRYEQMKQTNMAEGTLNFIRTMAKNAFQDIPSTVGNYKALQDILNSLG